MDKWIAITAVAIMLALPVACSEDQPPEQNCYWVDGALKCVRGTSPRPRWPTTPRSSSPAAMARITAAPTTPTTRPSR